MSHFAVAVLVEEPVTRDSAEEAVRPLLEPYRESDEWFGDGTRWDWWVIGGRWSGVLDGFDPGDEIENWEVCWLCDGTGVRPGGRERFGDRWFRDCNGCNGCMGNGLSFKHAPSWMPHDNDVLPIAEIDPTFVPAAIVTPDGNWHEEGRPGWFGTRIPDEGGSEPKPGAVWEAVVKAIYEQHPDATAVLVDCHV